MNNDLVALNVELALLRESYNVFYATTLPELNKLIDKWFTEPYKAQCTHRSVRVAHYGSTGIDVDFEIGFYNDLENRIDFGSDFNVTFNSHKQLLQINQGTMGFYSKEHIYQVKRAKTVAHIWDNIQEIESDFCEFCTKYESIMLSYEQQICDMERAISRLEQDIKKQEESEIEQSFNVGVKMCYDKNASIFPSNKLFFGNATITKITPKYVIATTDVLNKEHRLRKTDLIKHVFLKYITFEVN